MKDSHVLVVGLPDTGKSSFIQALDEVLKHPMGQEDLRSEGLANDRSYLESGKSIFLSGQPLNRTELPLKDTSAELWFCHPPTGVRGRLHLPDKKGEIFRSQWVNRYWETTYRESLSTICGAIVFVRADQHSRNDEKLGIFATDTAAGNQQGAKGDGTKEAQQAPKPTQRSWDMREASEQVQLVEVLQFLTEQGRPNLPLRTVVIISAWDTVGGPGDIRPKDPSAFLAREWALLAQYLKTNPEVYETRCYGVSAYGGKPGELTPDQLDRPAHERVQIVSGDGGASRSKDLTEPLRWLLGIT